MKLNQIKDELIGLSSQELDAKIDQYRQELFTLRINALTTHVKDVSQFEKLRKNVARGLTYKQQKEQQAKHSS
jgi:ribosomal protein L29